MIDISFIDIDDPNELEILSIKLKSQPFTVGEKINLQVVNRDKKVWDIENIDLIDYKIIEIESLVKVSYSKTVSQFIYFEIKIKKLKL